MSNSPIVLELWFDFSCPYAYLASRRARVFALAEHVAIDWRPMLLGGVFRGIGAGDGPMAQLSPAKAAHNIDDMHRWADLFGEPFRLPAAHPMRTVRALRVLLALPHSRWPVAIEAIFAAYWQRGEDITKDDVLARALRAAGVPDDDTTSALRRGDDPAIKDELRQRTDEAIALGMFGAPAWVLRRGGSPLLVWGQDRMVWLEAILGGWEPDRSAPPGGPRPFVASEPASAGAQLDVYFDVASPFAYLALTQLPALVATGASTRLVPILLGGLFRDIGQVDVPLLAFPPPKQRYVTLDMQRWARWWGVPFAQPAKFPQRTVAAQRLALLAAERGVDDGIRLAQAFGRALWAEQRDLEHAETLREILDREGFPSAWLDRTNDPLVKAALMANTHAATQAGVFGVPTFVTRTLGTAGTTQLFWGQDRLELVARALAGRAWTRP